MVAERFSKRAVLAAIERRRDTYNNGFHAETGRRIDPDNGWGQCDGESTQAAVAYGHWRALTDLAEAILSGEVVS